MTDNPPSIICPWADCGRTFPGSYKVATLKDGKVVIRDNKGRVAHGHVPASAGREAVSVRWKKQQAEAKETRRAVLGDGSALKRVTLRNLQQAAKVELEPHAAKALREEIARLKAMGDKPLPKPAPDEVIPALPDVPKPQAQPRRYLMADEDVPGGHRGPMQHGMELRGRFAPEYNGMWIPEGMTFHPGTDKQDAARKAKAKEIRRKRQARIDAHYAAIERGEKPPPETDWDPSAAPEKPTYGGIVLGPKLP